VSNHAGRPRPRRDPRSAIADVLGPLDGGRIEGGCAECDAHQSPRRVAHGVWELAIYHDDGCPVLHEIEARR